MKTRIHNACQKIKAAATIALQWLHSKISESSAIVILIVLNFVFAMILVVDALRPTLPGPITVSAQGKPGTAATLQLGDISIHPLTIKSANQPASKDRPAICLAFVSVKIEQRSWDGKLYLTSGPHIYPTVDVMPIGQDAPLKQIRTFAFNPYELCQRGPLKPEEMSLLWVHPNGVGILSLVGLEK